MAKKSCAFSCENTLLGGKAYPVVAIHVKYV